MGFVDFNLEEMPTSGDRVKVDGDVLDFLSVKDEQFVAEMQRDGSRLVGLITYVT